MKKFTLSLHSFLTLSCLFICSLNLYSCNSNQSVKGPLSASATADSIKNDEIKEPINHHYIALSQRAVIRPIYIETVKNVKAVHRGYQLIVNLKNQATYTIYKDIKLEISYFSTEGKELNKEIIVIKKAILPTASLKATQKVRHYKNTLYKVKILSATATSK